MIDFARARRQMVDSQLRTSSITDRRLLAAMGELPRERFVPEDRRDLAYIDTDLPLAPGRALSAPAPFARLVQLAVVGPGDRVLDLGCGTGYSAAVLSRLAGSVVAVETDAFLAARAAANLRAIAIKNVEMRKGALDGTGLMGGPFDVIVVEAAIDAVPAALWQHLHEHGRLVALIGAGMTAVAHLYVRTGSEIAGHAGFNARLPALGTPRESGEFVF